MTFAVANLYAQDCDYDYDNSMIMVMKDRVLSDENKVSTENDIHSYQKCIQFTKDSTKLFWLNHRIAFSLSELKPQSDSIGIYGVRAFKHDKKSFCMDYVKQYVYYERDTTFPFKRHYVDRVDSKESKEAKSYCLDNYKEAELQIYKDKELKDAAIKSSSKFNQKYFDALESIGNNDQKERKEKNINWKKQGLLDSLNRVELDKLYALHGFPTNDLVSQDGTTNAFMVMHHSLDCDWNEKWTKRFLKHKDQII